MFEAVSHRRILALGSQEFVHKCACLLNEHRSGWGNPIYVLPPHCNICVTIRATGRLVDKPHVLQHCSVEHVLGFDETRESAREASIEVWKPVLKLLPINYVAKIFHLIHPRSTEIGEPRPGVSSLLKIGGGSRVPKPVGDTYILVNLRVESALERSEFSSYRERHHLLMPIILASVENYCIPNGEERGEYRETTCDKGLKIVDEVAPAVATALPFNNSRLPKENNEHCCSSNRRPQKNGNRLFESNIHRLPLTHFTGHHTSHFLQQLQSQPVGLAT